MANTTTLLTSNIKLAIAEQFYYSAIAKIPQGTSDITMSSIYCFMGKIDNWNNEVDPPTPKEDQSSLKQIFKNLFIVKRLYAGDIGMVIERIDWTEGTVYDKYTDTENMFQLDENGYLYKHFYVKNQYDQVFKCLWNVNGTPSYNEPYFEPGTYGSYNIYQGPDGYKWKYMYTIDSGLKVKFMDKEWMPVPNIGFAPAPQLTNAGFGDIETINVVNGGSGYDSSNAIVEVVITGDGIGATAVPMIYDGVVTDVVITNPGSNYTYADVSIISTPPTGTNAELTTDVSPIAGHGYDPFSELGVHNVMLTCEFNGSENEVIPTDIDYHQIGVIINPSTLSSNGLPANGAIYKAYTEFVVAPGFGLFVQDEIVYQGSIENPSFTAKVLSFDSAGNILKLINTNGTITTSSTVFGKTSLTTRTLLSYSTPDFQIMSGYLAYIENRSSIQRSSDSIEQFRLVLGH